MLRERSRNTSCSAFQAVAVERRVEQLLDPGRKQIFVGAIPVGAQRPNAAGRRSRPRRCVVVHGDLARDRAAPGCRELAPATSPAQAHRLRRTSNRAGRRARARFDGDAAVGRDQRKLAVERLFGGKQDAQRRAFPRRERRRQHRDLGRVSCSCRTGRRPARRRPKTAMPRRSATPQLPPSNGAMKTRETMPSPPGLERGNNSANVLASYGKNPQTVVLSPWPEYSPSRIISPIGRRREPGVGRKLRFISSTRTQCPARLSRGRACQARANSPGLW